MLLMLAYIGDYRFFGTYFFLQILENDEQYGHDEYT